MVTLRADEHRYLVTASGREEALVRQIPGAKFVAHVGAIQLPRQPGVIIALDRAQGDNDLATFGSGPDTGSRLRRVSVSFLPAPSQSMLLRAYRKQFVAESAPCRRWRNGRWQPWRKGSTAEALKPVETLSGRITSHVT